MSDVPGPSLEDRGITQDGKDKGSDVPSAVGLAKPDKGLVPAPLVGNESPPRVRLSDRLHELELEDQAQDSSPPLTEPANGILAADGTTDSTATVDTTTSPPVETLTDPAAIVDAAPSEVPTAMPATDLLADSATSTTATTVPPRTEVAEGLKPASPEDATRIADALIDAKISEIQRKGIPPEKLPADEQNLLAIQGFMNGFTRTHYNVQPDKQVKLGKNLDAVNKDGNAVTVSALKDDDVIKGVREYKCVLADGTEATVTAEALVSAHKQQQAESIAKNFTSVAQKDVVAWRLKGGEGDPPSNNRVNTAETELNAGPFERADQTIREQIGLLKLSLDDKDLPAAARETNRALLADLMLAQEFNGPIGQIHKINALQRLHDQSGDIVKQELQRVLTELEPHKQGVKDSVDALLENSGAPQDKIKEWREAAAGPDGLSKLLSDPIFMALPDMTKAMFGRELSGADAARVDKLIDEFVDTHLPEHQRSAWETAKATGKKTGWVLAIILAVPAAVALGAAYAGSSMARAGQR